MPYHFSQSLWQIGDVQISRSFISLCLEARVEGLLSKEVSAVSSSKSFIEVRTYSGKANLVTKTMEPANTHLRVSCVKELGKAKTIKLSASDHAIWQKDKPFASTGSGVNDRLGGLDSTPS